MPQANELLLVSELAVASIIDYPQEGDGDGAHPLLTELCRELWYSELAATPDMFGDATYTPQLRLELLLQNVQELRHLWLTRLRTSGDDRVPISGPFPAVDFTEQDMTELHDYYMNNVELWMQNDVHQTYNDF